MFRPVNKTTMFKMITLLLYSFYFFFILLNGSVRLYITPKLIPALAICACAFAFFAIFLIRGLFNNYRKSNVKGSYLIFVLPILLTLLFPPAAIFGSASAVQMVGNTPKTQASIPVLSEEENHLMENDFVLTDGKIKPQDSNYVKWEQEIYENTSKYKDQIIVFTGFVYKDRSFKKNEFVAGRSLMICCAADIQLAGYMCNYEEAKSIQNKGWYVFTCKITEGTMNGNKVPILKVLHIKPTEIPENEYVYP